MEFLITPDIAYVAVVAGILLFFMALVTPGTNFLEIGSALVLLFAIYCGFVLSINPIALFIIAIGLFPFFYALRTPKYRGWMLGSSTLLVIAGSIFLFADRRGNSLVNPFLATFTSVIYGGLVFWGLERALRLAGRPSSLDVGSLVGQVGVAKTEINLQGSVLVQSELWSARSSSPIDEGSSIRVVAIEGFILVVEPVALNNSN